MSVDRSELPPGWIDAKLAEVARWGSGGTPSRSRKAYFGGKIPWIKTGELGPKFILRSEEKITQDAVDNSSAKIFPKGAVALAMYGATIGKASILGVDAATNQACAVGVPDERLISSEYLYFYLVSQQRKFVEQGQGGAQPNISQGIVKGWPIPLAPRAEQDRITAKVGNLIEAVARCRARLNRAPDLLRRFREAVLEAAVSGRLTDEWRIEKRGSHSLDAWQSVTIGDVAEVGTGSTPLRSQSDFYAADGIPWITSASTAQPVVTSSTEFVTPAAIRAHRLRIYPKGTLLVAMYGEGKTRGQVTELGIDATINQACAAIRVHEERANPEFVRLVLEAAYERMRKLAEGGNQPNLNLTKIKTFGIYLPPLDEQTQIVLYTRDLMGTIESLQRRCVNIRWLADKLTPALLAKAFRGQLVLQDTTAEPAGRMLERIRAGQKAVDVTGKREATVVVHGRGRQKISVREEKRGEGRARKRA